MAPKTSRGKGVATDAGEKEAPESELAVPRTQHAYFPSTVDAVHLRDYFLPLWGRKTTGHPATRIVPAFFTKPGPNRYPFFVNYFSCGLCPPFSDFFNDIMHTYGFHLLYFTPNVVACMALFTHLCEGFAGVLPSTVLFCHYFYPLVASLGSQGPWRRGRI